jgi:hypothetical protein
MTSLRVNTRDVAFLAELGEVGVVDTPMVHSRHFPLDKTGQACRRRLRLYLAHDLILSSPHPLSFSSLRGGRPRAIHRLAPLGAEAVLQATGALPPRIARSEPLKPDTLLHRLGVATVHLAVLDACKQHRLPKPAWILEQDTNPNVAPDAPFSERFVLYELFRPTETSSVSCRPDASTLLRIPAAAASSWLELIVYWEFDRATETLAKVAHKLESYRLLLQTGRYREHWPNATNATVRLFFVTPSPERLRHIASTLRQHAASDIVRLTTLSALDPSRLLTEPIWETVTGESRRIWTRHESR